MQNLLAYQTIQAFKNKELSCSQILNFYFHRIETFDHEIQAFLSLDKEGALEQAEALDKKRSKGLPLGKLAGIPVAIKDNIHVKGMLTTCASKFLQNYKAPFSATVVKLIQEQDGIVIGKTNLDEFAMGSTTENSALKTTKNPWSVDCNPGGSSGGSAAAVSANLVPLALGSDTGGSIRQPAAFTGTVGFKPTYGRVSRYGLVAFASSLDQIGPMTRSVADAALLMEVIGQHCQQDSTSLRTTAPLYFQKLQKDLKGKKIGVPFSFLKDLRADTKENFYQSLEQLKLCGAEVIDVDLDILENSIAVYYILATAEASTNLARFDGVRYGLRSSKAKDLEELYDLSKEEGFGQEVKKRILLGTYVLSSGYQEDFYKKAQKVRSLIINQFDKVFAKCDLIAMPTSPVTSFPLNSIQDPLEMYLQDIYTIAANLAGLPAISLPSGFNACGLPFGLQFLGRFEADQSVLNAAYHFESTQKYINQIPSRFNQEIRQ
ncbi:MAG: Asp-tRNA(Asn)/Glu-tRNA(Gln) amidotransferase subunit GatA [Rhabdochlamydiaceae bacterium]